MEFALTRRNFLKSVGATTIVPALTILPAYHELYAPPTEVIEGAFPIETEFRMQAIGEILYRNDIQHQEGNFSLILPDEGIPIDNITRFSFDGHRYVHPPGSIAEIDWTLSVNGLVDPEINNFFVLAKPFNVCYTPGDNKVYQGKFVITEYYISVGA